MMDDWNGPGRGMHPWHGEGAEHAFGPWHWLGMSIGLAILIVAIVALVLVLRRSSAVQSRTSATLPGSPEEILRARFARGEIEAEEYRSRLQVLSEPPPG